MEIICNIWYVLFEWLCMEMRKMMMKPWLIWWKRKAKLSHIHNYCCWSLRFATSLTDFLILKSTRIKCVKDNRRVISKSRIKLSHSQQWKRHPFHINWVAYLKDYPKYSQIFNPPYSSTVKITKSLVKNLTPLMFWFIIDCFYFPQEISQ